MQSNKIIWSLYQDFIYAIQDIEDGRFYNDSPSYHRIAGASLALCSIAGDDASYWFHWCQDACAYIRRFKKGDDYSPLCKGVMLAYALRFSVGIN